MTSSLPSKLTSVQISNRIVKLDEKLFDPPAEPVSSFVRPLFEARYLVGKYSDIWSKCPPSPEQHSLIRTNAFLTVLYYSIISDLQNKTGEEMCIRVYKCLINRDWKTIIHSLQMVKSEKNQFYPWRAAERANQNSDLVARDRELTAKDQDQLRIYLETFMLKIKQYYEDSLLNSAELKQLQWINLIDKTILALQNTQKE